MMAKRGFFSRLAHGWAMGLTELDKLTWGGTIACVAFAGLIVHHHSSTAGGTPWSRQQSVLQARPACANPTGSALAGLTGKRGWITTGLGTEMTATPGYSRYNRMVFPYTPLVVLHDLGGSLEVIADLGTGKTARGFVRADRVQYDNPAAHAVAEDGWVKVTAPDGAQMRFGPDLNAGGFRPPARPGTVLHEIAAVRGSRFHKMNTKDFYLVDRPGTENCHSPAWVARWQVEKVAKP